MSTIARQAAKSHVAEIMRDPSWALVLGKYQLDMNLGVYPQGYVDCVVQKWDALSYDLVDAWCFANVHTWVQTGQLAVFSILAGAYPPRDNEHQTMTSALKALPYPFSGQFWGGTQDEDGLIGWSRPVLASYTLKSQNYRGFVIVPPCNGCPLEVGTTSAEKTHQQLNPGGSRLMLARWPYNSEYIYVFTSSFHAKNSDRFETLRREKYGTMRDFTNPFELWENES